ncbi:cation:proton antiporter [Terriglobus aquaticus]|uniref:Cation:proton antiporter n=1 Tax=Terriglobus aquaticus TaxID=940139 RepID=A0ABW9KJ41_9BACT|nr:sodium:proton antiporter [Terriglobus aquaticus]
MLTVAATVVVLAAAFGLISVRWLRLPIVVGTMLLTVLSSVGLLALSGAVPSLRQAALHSFGQLNYEAFMLHGFLALLLFAGAFLLDIESLWEERVAIVILSVFATVISTLLVGCGIRYCAPWTGFHPSWIQALLFGAVISPTDPIAVLEMLRRVAAPRWLQAQLAGESLFNDGVAAVLFITLLGIAEQGRAPSVPAVVSHLLIQSGGGLALGCVLAWPVARLMRAVDAYQIDILMTLSLALGGYAVAEHLHVSAPLEAVAAGLALRWESRRNPNNIAREEIEHFWSAIDEVQNSVLFVLMGLQCLVVAYSRGFLLLGGVSIVVVNVARFASVACALLALRLIQPHRRSSLAVLSWGGLRGGLSIALALSLPFALGREWILATTFIVVTFSIVIKGGSMDIFLKRFAPQD